MTIDYIKNLVPEDESFLGKYSLRELEQTLNADPVKKVLAAKPFDEATNIFLSAPSEVFIAFFQNNIQISTDEFIMSFENFIKNLEYLTQKDLENWKFWSQNINLFNQAKDLFDTQIKFQDWILYFIWNRKNEKILNNLLQYMIKSYRMKIWVFPLWFSNIISNNSLKKAPKNFLYF